MSALPLTTLRPLAFPSHRWQALVCLRTGRILAFVASSDASRDAARHGDADLDVPAFALGASAPYSAAVCV